MSEKRSMTTPEAAEFLGVSESSLRHWRCIGYGPRYRKLGRSVRYRTEDLIAFEDGQERRSTSDEGAPLPEESRRGLRNVATGEKATAMGRRRGTARARAADDAA